MTTTLRRHAWRFHRRRRSGDSRAARALRPDLDDERFPSPATLVVGSVGLLRGWVPRAVRDQDRALGVACRRCSHASHDQQGECRCGRAIT
jgi:hypothetical protein